MKLILLVLSLICLKVQNLHAQQFPIQKLAVEDGLGHPIVYRTYQTHDGYLWFSTDNGLTRYDGVNFKNFTSRDGLGSNFIFEIAEWNNKLYISTFGAGLMVLDSGTFKPAVKEDVEQPLYPLYMVAYGDELWIIDRFKKAFRFKDNTFNAIRPADLQMEGEHFPRIHQIEKAMDGGLYLATAHGLFHFRYNTFTRIEVPGLRKNESIMQLVEISNKMLMLATDDRLIEFDLSDNSMVTWLDKESFAAESSLIKDAEGNVWAASMSGNLYVCKRGSGRSRHVIKVSEGTVINQIYQDREKNIWLSTYGEGAWWIQSIYIRNYSIKGCIVADMVVDHEKNNLVITSTNAGLRFFHQEESRYLTQATDDQLARFFKNRKSIVSAHSLPNGSLLFSSGTSLYKWGKKKIDSISVRRAIATLYPQTKKNRIWIGSRFDLAYADTAFKKVVSFPGFDKSTIRSIAEDKDGRILLGTDSGVRLENGDDFILLPSETGERLYVNTLYLHHETEKLWVGTNSGLGFIENNQVKMINHPLATVRCNTITADDHGNLWVGTVNGLLRIHKEKFELIGTREGIAQSNIIKLIYQAGNGLLTLLTPNAISIIEIESFLKNSSFTLPDIVIEKISAGNGDITYHNTPIRLHHSISDLTISVSSALIKNRDKVSFSYRINDENWNEFDGQKISLHSIPYGALTITVRVQEEFKPSSSKTTSLNFFIERPFYVQWWFLTLLLIMLSGAIGWTILFFSRRKNIKLAEENKRLDVEHKALRNLLNPHFLYNAINSIHAFILQNDQRKTLGYLAKFSQLVRLNLELLSTESVSLDKELKNLSLYLEFEKLRFADKLNYEIRIDPTLDQADVQLPSFFIQPFLENAIWHGLLPRPEGGNLLLQLEKRNGHLLITIDDDGVGINTSLKKPKTELDERTSMGISIIKDRIGLLNKFQENYDLNIVDKSELNGKGSGTGTVVKIKVPIG